MQRKFYQTTRIRQDKSELEHDNKQNSLSATYTLNNFRPECLAKDAKEFATISDLNFNGSHHVGIGGCNIDDNSDILLRSLSRDKCKLSLNTRQFITVPFMGRGTNDPIDEFKLLQGDHFCNRKSINPSSEISYLNYSQTPLISSLEKSMSNGAHVGNKEQQQWVRAAIPSRELTRDKDYD